MRDKFKTLLTIFSAFCLITYSLSAQDSVSTSQLPTTLTPQSSYTVSIPYTAIQERDIAVEFWKNTTTWLGNTTTTVPAGSGTITPTISLPAGVPVDGTDYVWKANIRPVGTTWQQNIPGAGGQITGVVVSSGSNGGGGNTGSGAWIESGGMVVIEPEHGDLANQWITRPSTYLDDPTMAGSLGSGWIEWTGQESYNTTIADNAAPGISTFRFVIQTPGVYTFRWRTKQYNTEQAGDLGNDTYVKFETGTPQQMTGHKGNPYTITQFTKVWIQSKNAWEWNTNFEPHHGEFVYSPRVYYAAGEHEIKIAGRSRGHSIDRIVLYNSSVAYNEATFNNAAESQRSGGSSGPIVYDAIDDFSNKTSGQVAYYDDITYDSLAINPANASYDDTRFARASLNFNGASDDYDVTITTLTEFDGECTYRLLVNGSVVGTYQNSAVGNTADLQPNTHTWNGITLNNGDTIAVESNAHSNNTHVEAGPPNGFAWARGRWRQLELSPGTATPPPSAAENTPSAGIYGETDGIGNYRKWHKVTVAFQGPNTNESATPNPFTDYRLNVTFSHPASGKTYIVPGYYSADGNSGETGASAGNIWRAHFAPDELGTWNYSASFRTGTNIAVDSNVAAGTATSFNGASGSFSVVTSDKTGRDHRGKGRLQYDGTRYLKFAETGEAFLKTGADAPENFLNYLDFDNTYNHGGTDYRKSWAAHIQDWNTGDPAWKSGKGKGIIGAINYLASEGQNVFSFLTYNAGGDSKDVWPYVSHNNPLRFDCSKLDQWEIIFTHADKMGMYLHFKTQETENDDLNGPGAAYALNDGNLGNERKLYYRELMARFGHHMALNWNLGEETTQTTVQQQAMAQYFRDHDPYQHHIVIHTYPDQQELRYRPLLGSASELTGASVQTNYSNVHAHTLQWISESAASGRQWVVANDEQGPANGANPPDNGWPGYSGNTTPSQKQMRWMTVWGNFMAGGAGIELYAGYNNPQSDLTLDDFRSRDRMWDYCRHALTFFTDHLPFDEMENANSLIGNGPNSNSKYCFAKTGEVYAIYLPNGGSTSLDLSGTSGTFDVRWFNPRDGGALQTGTAASVAGGGMVSTGYAPSQVNEDWVVLVRSSGPNPNVGITLPANGTEVLQGTNVTFRTAISDNPNFDRVEFYLNGNLIDTKNTGPYEVGLNNLALGLHNLSVIEVDSEGNRTMDSIALAVIDSLGEVTRNFNATDDVMIQGGTTLFNDNYLKVQNSGPARVAYLKFNVTGIPAGDVIKSATLKLQEFGDTGNGTLRFYDSADTSWTELSINTVTPPTTQSQIGTYTGSVGASQIIDVDVSSLITGNGTYTIIVQMDTGGNDIWFGSSETASAPELTVVSGEDTPTDMVIKPTMVTDVMMITWWPMEGVLEYTDDLGSGNWQPVTSPPNPYHVEFDQSQRFYRIVEPQTP
ncbi:MAG: DUF5060 domain-containing protein [Verrucomicrobiota bacterium]